MKIYYASQSFYPHIGGVSTYLLNLCSEMVKKGNDVVEVHLRPFGEENIDDIKGIEIHRVPREPIDKEIMSNYSKFKEAVYEECHFNKNKFAKPAHKMEGFVDFNKVNEYFGEEIRSLLEEQPADIVHIHDFQLLFAYKYVPRGTPLVLTWHIPFIETMSKYLADFLIKHMKEYDKVVFSSEDYIKAAVKLGLPKENAELIYPIVNTNLFRVLNVNKKDVRKRYGIPEDAKVILCVQRIDSKSGHKQLIRAFPKVLEKVPKAKLVFVGGESMSSKLSENREILVAQVKQLVEDLRLNNDILFLGNIDYMALPELYNSVDLASLCSRNEGFGLSITEAMSCGNPVVGTKVSGISIQVKDGFNGYLVDVGDIEATADRLIKILSEPEIRDRMGQNALKTVEENFKMEQGIEKHMVLYNTVLKMKDELRKIEYLNISDIKAIVMDLDRTITDNPAKQEFDPADYDAELLNQLKELGTDLILATGRNIYYVMELCSAFSIWRCVVAENGAVIYIPPTKKTITINTDYMKKAKKIIKELELPKSIKGKVIISVRAEDEKQVREKLGALVNKVSFYRNVNEVMILPRDVDKGLGLRIAMQYLNIDMDKTIVIGDGENDIGMFLNPGFKIAVSNAHPRLKKLANLVTEKPSTKGIREIMEKLRA